MDEVPTQAPDFVVPLSIAFDSDLTAKLSPALRAARVKAVCPSKAAVRALNLCGGVNPSNPPLPAMGFAPPALVKESTHPRSDTSFYCTSSTADAVPLPLIGEGLSTVEWERDFQYRATQQRFARRDMEGALPFAERRKIEECSAGTASHSSVNSSLLTPHSTLHSPLSTLHSPPSTLSFPPSMIK